ncbi:hypothetical protein FSP39_017129 [Pinctada imbricata]|uniref:Sodium/glucose cotransporter 4 n=1 Tax=Pinctada imbricata TaxID=66713 RepID=A0AA88XER0_PINIB|nr:hypothetical protein FSP39_017129 [Pinctada imbricata]
MCQNYDEDDDDYDDSEDEEEADGKDNTSPVGASIYASNIGAPMFIGLAGTGAASGLAVTIYEWHAIFCLIALGWLYMPVYTACGKYIPLALTKVGGMDGLWDSYMTAASNLTLANQSKYSCGMPRNDSYHIFRDAVTADIPWTGAVLGLSIMGMYTWDNDQIIVQRALSAKNLTHAKAGALFGGILKLTGFMLFIVPGMISRIFFPEEIACADPDACEEICRNPAGCSNIAYPLLVLRVMPTGLRGLMLAALLAALMSSLTSILNSASSIMTLDLWRQCRKKAKERELMIVGRVTVLVLVVISIIWLPILEQIQGGMFWVYFISIRAYLLPPMFMMFFLGLMWKRTTEQAVFWGLMSSLVVGIIRLVLDFTYPAPLCGSEEADDRPAVVSKIEFLHFSTILSAFALIVMVSISLVTKPRPEHKLHKVTWWTRHDTEDPEFTSDEEENDSEDDDVSAIRLTPMGDMKDGHFDGDILESAVIKRQDKSKYNRI